jgi:hypothetical protein
MNGYWSNGITFLIIRYDDQTMSVPSNRDHAPRDGIEVSLSGENFSICSMMARSNPLDRARCSSYSVQIYMLKSIATLGQPKCLCLFLRCRTTWASAAGAELPVTYDLATELQTPAVPPSAASPGSTLSCGYLALRRCNQRSNEAALSVDFFPSGNPSTPISSSSSGQCMP